MHIIYINKCNLENSIETTGLFWNIVFLGGSVLLERCTCLELYYVFALLCAYGDVKSILSRDCLYGGKKITQKQFSGEKMAFLNIRVQLSHLEIQRSKTTIEMIFASTGQ